MSSSKCRERRNACIVVEFVTEESREEDPDCMFGSDVKGGAGHVTQCVGHNARGLEAGGGRLSKKSERSEKGFELAGSGSAEEGKPSQ